MASGAGRKPVIVMVTGLADVEVGGNQSLRNTIEYLAQAGYRIVMFSFMPGRYENLVNPRSLFGDCVELRRAPAVLVPFLWLGKTVKDLFVRLRAPWDQCLVSDRDSGTYLREHGSLGRLLYLAFMFLFYLPFETLRVLLHAWRQNAELLYGVNCQGALVASLVGRVLRKPVVTRFHGVSISEADLRSWVTKLLVLDEIVGLKAPANAVIITNDGTRGDRIAELLGVDAKRVYFWRNGWDKADLEYDDPAWSAEAFKGELGIQGRRVLLMVSRLASWKRVDRGIRCLASLVKHYGRRDTILLVVGDGPLKNTLEDLAQKLDVREYVVFAGRVPHRSIWRYYRISDVFLSLYDVSNLGNPLFEAMYFGLPIVTLKGPGVADLLKDGYNAILVGEEELDEELPRKVNWLLQEGRMAAELGENAKQTLASNVLSWEERMRLETELIGKILIA